MIYNQEKQMYATVEEKPIQKTAGDKTANKRPSWSVLVLFPIILLILIFGATMGTVIGFKSQLKNFEDRIALLEESTALKLDLHENIVDRLQKKIAEETPLKVEPSRPAGVPEKTVKRHHYAESPRLVKVSGETPKKNYRSARSGDTLNNINAPL